MIWLCQWITHECLGETVMAPRKELLPRRFRGGLLRRLRPDDLAAFQAYRSDPELGRY